MVNETTKFSSDKTARSDAQYVAKLFESLKTLDEKYECKKQKAKPENDQSLIQFQTKFWSKIIASFEDSAKELEQMERDVRNDEIDQLLLDFYILAALHKHKINEHWSITDLESRKRTILIALVELGQLHDEISTQLKEPSQTISLLDLNLSEFDESD